MKFRVMIGLLALAVVLAPMGGALAQKKVKISTLWNGNQWTRASYDARAGYVFGVGNLCDFEVESKGKGDPISRALFKNLKNETVATVVEQVDKFYRENPDKLYTSVLEVILVRCAKACPPEMLK